MFEVLLCIFPSALALSGLLVLSKCNWQCTNFVQKLMSSPVEWSLVTFPVSVSRIVSSYRRTLSFYVSNVLSPIDYSSPINYVPLLLSLLPTPPQYLHKLVQWSMFGHLLALTAPNSQIPFYSFFSQLLKHDGQFVCCITQCSLSKLQLSCLLCCVFVYVSSQVPR